MSASLILASASPQRRTLLEGLGLKFQIVPSSIHEPDILEDNPPERAKILSLHKARDVSAIRTDSWVIGCDTLVVASDGTLLEKPTDASDARRMMNLHSGRTSLVHSGLTIISPEGKEYTGLSTSSVTFKELTEEEKEWWVKLGLWEGRSGGFQIDGKGQLLIQEITGDWTSIVGFPVFLFGELCRQARAPFFTL
jgi:septum formation protein